MSEAIKLKDVFQEADGHIKSGRIPQAAQILRRISGNLRQKKWSGDDLFQYAELCRRSEMFTAGLKALNPLVRGDKGQVVSEKPEWTVTYAGLLTKVGSAPEAIQLLASCRPRTADCDLYTAFAFLTQWDHAQARFFLESFLKWPGLPEYKRMIGQVNLAAALVKTAAWDEADFLLQSIQEQCRKQNWTLLYKNSLEIRAEWAIETGELKMASQQIQEAESFGRKDRYDLQLAVQKIRMAEKSGRNFAEIAGEAERILEHARTIRHFETIRSMDLIIASSHKNQSLADRIFFGTPYPAFRQRLLERLKDWYQPSESYDWNCGPEGKAVVEFDVFRGRVNNQELKPGQATHRILRSLTRDFYRPSPLGLLHSHLFPGQYFNPNSSKSRVVNVVNRARDWIEEAGLPFRIEVRNNSFQLTSMEACAFRLELRHCRTEDNQAEAQVVAVERLKALQTERGFTSSAAAEKLNLSVRSANNLIKWACEKKVLVKIGTGRSTRYKFAA